MNCGFCGLEFDGEAGRRHCQGCLQITACASVRCPRCGYEMPEEPAFVARLLGARQPRVELSMANGAPRECPLADLAPGDEAVVSRLAPETGETDLRKLLALGVMPGVPIKVVRRTPSLVFKLGFSEFAIDADLARSVIVRG